MADATLTGTVHRESPQPAQLAQPAALPRDVREAGAEQAR